MPNACVSDACVELRAVLTVFICLSMKPFNLDYRGEDAMCSMCCLDMNLTRSSDEKGVCCQ